MNPYDNRPLSLADTVRDIKHKFMVYRNGIVADSLRKAGYPYQVIFGLQLPQLTAIAREIPEEVDRHELANVLWADREVRESRLLAPYLYESARLTLDDALALAKDVRTPEEADILAFRLLRHHPSAAAMLPRLPEPARTSLARFL